jgi:hypothetical protein
VLLFFLLRNRNNLLKYNESKKSLFILYALVFLVISATAQTPTSVIDSIKTKLWILDHNFDMTQTVAKVLLDDPKVKKITDRIAFHDYRGRPGEMAILGHQHPDVPCIISEMGQCCC